MTKPTRNRSTPESREFWDAAEKTAAEVTTWTDERRAGINVADGRANPEHRDHWISRSDYEELERRCDGLERELSSLRTRCRQFAIFLRDNTSGANDKPMSMEVYGARLVQEIAALRAELNRRPRVGDRVRATEKKIELLRELLGDERDGTLEHIGESETLGYYVDALEAVDREDG